MASREQIGKVIATIKTVYSYYAKDTDLGYLVSVWEKLLKDYTDQEVSAGLFGAMQKCQTPPTPAHVIAEIESILDADRPSDAYIIEAYKDALAAVYHNSINLGVAMEIDGISLHDRAMRAISIIYDEMPDEAKEHVGSVKAMIDKASRTRGEKELSIEEATFRKALPSIRERLKYRQAAARLATAERKKIND